MPLLTWLTREEDIEATKRVAYRLLEEVHELSTGDGNNGNMLIQANNLDALKTLLPFYAGRIKCVYIDPPYNTRSAFEHYDDNLEHTRWLAMMWPRLELLRELLSEDGSIWVSIDDNEGHYLKVVMDEVFGRKNFIDTIIWRKNYSPKSSARHFSSDHDYVLVFSKDAEAFQPNLMPRTEKQDRAYKNRDNDPRGPWKTSDLSARNFYSLGRYAIKSPDGRVIEGPPGGNYWRVSEDNFWKLVADNRIWWGKIGDSIPQIKRFLSEVKQGITPQTIWPYDEVGHTQDAKKEILKLFGNDVFLTPKPERLMQRIIHIATNPGDFVSSTHSENRAWNVEGRSTSGVTGSKGISHKGKRLIPLLPVRLDIDLRNATVSAGGLRKSQRSPCLIRVFQQWEGTPHHALPEPRG